MLPTAAPAMNQAAAPAPAAPPAEGGEGYVICMAVRPDGSFSVYKESAGERGQMTTSAGNVQDEGELAGEEVEESERIDTIEGALKAVYGIYQENQEGSEGEEDMQAGYDDPGAM